MKQHNCVFTVKVLWILYRVGGTWPLLNTNGDVLGTGDVVRFVNSFIYDSTCRHYNLFLQCALTLWRCVSERSWFLCSGPLISFDLFLSAFRSGLVWSRYLLQSGGLEDTFLKGFLSRVSEDCCGFQQFGCVGIPSRWLAMFTSDITRTLEAVA
jgi:hypothetical protein